MMFAFIRSIMISWQGLIGRSNKTKSNTCTLIIANQTSFFFIYLYITFVSLYREWIFSGNEQWRRAASKAGKKPGAHHQGALRRPAIRGCQTPDCPWTVFISVSNNYRTYLSQIFRFPKRINFQRMLMVSTREEKKLILVKEKNLRMEKKKPI